jgi:hypothetical protein
MRRTALCLIVSLAAPGVAVAQDAQYWTYQYGTRANLLGGAVVGSAVDVSATYYNPGALSLIKDPEIIATSKVLELSNLALEPDFGTEVALDNLRFDFAPGFFGGTIPFGFLGDHVLGYSVFTRHLFKATLDAVAVGTLDQLPSLEADGDFLGLARLKEDMSESWFGLTWSAPLGRRTGFGVTTFVAYRSQKRTSRVTFEALSDVQEGALSTREIAWSFWDARLLLKAGLTLEWQGVSLGLTTTTPSLSVLNSGRTLINVAQFGVDADGDGIDDPIFAASYQEGLDASYKSPWSAALGAAFSPRGTTTLHLTAEYFGKMKERAVLDLEDFVAQSSGDTISADLTQRYDDVLNFGLGVEQTFSPTFSGYASFRTDFSAKVAGGQSDMATSSWDIYYVTAGAAFRIGTADLTFGVAFGWGDDFIDGLAPPGDGDEPVVGVPESIDVKYRTLRFILAFSI